VIILFADDLGYGDLGSYGHPTIRTPRLDALAAEGQRWTDFYAAAPVCSPSRGALLTGRLPNRTGLYGRRLNVLFPNDPGGMPPSERTIAEALGERGYATAVVGKWHLGDRPEAYPTRHGFDYWFGLPYSNDMDWVAAMSFEEVLALAAAGRMAEVQEEIARRQALYLEPRNEYWNVPLVRSERSPGGVADEVVERPARQASLTRRYTEEAVAFIRRHQARPFFLYLPYTMPHTPLFSGDEFAGTSRGGRYGDVVEELDWSVGVIVDALHELDLAADTLVVFTSDNGPWLAMDHHGGSAGPLRDGKGTTFEGGMRVPAIFSWPGRIRPGVTAGIGSTLDLSATALALAGAGVDDDADGLDLSGTLLKGEPSPRSSLAYYRSGELMAFRHGEYKLHLVTQGAYGRPPERAVHQRPLLYHLGEDPGERFDVAGRYPEMVETLELAVAAHREGLVEAPPLFDRRLQPVHD
jgi:arylsulfatase A